MMAAAVVVVMDDSSDDDETMRRFLMQTGVAMDFRSAERTFTQLRGCD